MTAYDASHGGYRDQIKVLIADDDRWVTKALAFTLAADPSFRVLGAVNSGEAVVESYRRERPDVVLMDVNMPPGMSGVDAILEIREDDPTAKVVVLTTIRPGPGLARALDAGASAVLNKNASDATLVETVRSVARGDDPALLKQLAGDVLVSGIELANAPIVAPRLTPKERDVLLLVCEGHSYEDISSRLNLSVTTVKTHAKGLRQKLDAKSLAQMVLRAIEFRFITR